MSTREIVFPNIIGIKSGAGCVQECLTQTIDHIGAQRVFLVTTPSLTRTRHIAAIENLLGSRFAGKFVESVAHTPASVVAKATDAAREANADLLLSFGGSSVVDLTKGIAIQLAEGDDYQRLKVRFSPESGVEIPALREPKLPHFSIPTTLSAAEYTHAAGITDDVTRAKHAYADPNLVPKWIFQDPNLCDATPTRLWLSTGAKIFSDCIEVLCSRRSQPFTDALALKGLELLYRNLLDSADSNNVAARTKCLSAAFLALGFANNSSIGLVGAARHQLGAGFGMPHGDASAIMLPHVLRWNVDHIVEKLSEVSRFLGIDNTADSRCAAEACILAVEDFLAALKIPTRLSEFNVDEGALPAIADNIVADHSIHTNPRLVRTADDVLSVLRAAY